MTSPNISLQNFTAKLTFVHPVSKAVRHGTGILLSDRIAITPAHNIYDREGKAFYRNFQLEISSGQIYGVTQYCPMQDYISKQSEKQSKLYDYAVLHLDRSVKIAKSLCQSMLQKESKYQQLILAIQERDKRMEESEKERYKMGKQLESAYLQNNKLREQLTILKDQARSLVTMSKALQDQITYLRERTEAFPQFKHDLSFSLNESMIGLNRSSSVIAPIEESMKLTHSILLSKEGRFTWDLRDPQLQKWYMVEESNGRVRCKQTNFNQQRIIATQPLPPRSRLQFTMINYADRNSSFSFGIVSSHQKGADFVEFYLSIGSACGSISVNKDIKFGKETSLKMGKGQSMTMEVHLDKLLVEFKNKKTSKTVQMKPFLAGQQFFPFIMLWNKGDEASLIPFSPQ